MILGPNICPGQTIKLIKCPLLHLNSGSYQKSWQHSSPYHRGFILEVWPGSLSVRLSPLCGPHNAEWIAGGWGRLAAMWDTHTHILSPFQRHTVRIAPSRLDDELSGPPKEKKNLHQGKHTPDSVIGWCVKSWSERFFFTRGRAGWSEEAVTRACRCLRWPPDDQQLLKSRPTPSLQIFCSGLRNK